MFKIQTPFRAWRVPYSGVVSIKNIFKGSGDFSPNEIIQKVENKVFIKAFLGKNETALYSEEVSKTESRYIKENVEVKQGEYIYFVTDYKFDPLNCDVEWDIEIKYERVKPFEKKFLSPIIVPNNETFETKRCGGSTLEKAREEADKDARKLAGSGYVLYTWSLSSVDTSEDDKGNVTYYYCSLKGNLKPDWYKYLTDLGRVYTKDHIEAGYFIPGTYTIDQFNELKNAIKPIIEEESKKVKSTETQQKTPAEKQAELYKEFTSFFKYDAESELYFFVIDKNLNEDISLSTFYDIYLSNESLKSLKEKTLLNYTEGGVNPYWSGTSAYYGNVVEKNFSQERLDENANGSMGAKVLENGNVCILIGKDLYAEKDSFGNWKALSKNGSSLRDYTIVEDENALKVTYKDFSYKFLEKYVDGKVLSKEEYEKVKEENEKFDFDEVYELKGNIYSLKEGEEITNELKAIWKNAGFERYKKLFANVSYGENEEITLLDDSSYEVVVLNDDISFEVKKSKSFVWKSSDMKVEDKPGAEAVYWYAQK